MRPIVLSLIIVALVQSMARAESFGYVDVAKVNATATEPKRTLGPIRAEMATIQRELDTASKPEAKPESVKVAQEHVDAHNKRADDAQAVLSSHLMPILVKIKAERHLTDILPIIPVTPTKNNLTDEVIRLWNAADVEATAAENARLKAENETLKSKAPAAPNK